MRYYVRRSTYNGMSWEEAEGCTMQGARNKVARILRAKRKAGMRVVSLGDNRWEFKWEDQGISDSEGYVSIEEQYCNTCSGAREITCYDCNGRGYLKCPVCAGEESEDCDTCDDDGDVECELCGTSGTLPCPDCVD